MEFSFKILIHFLRIQHRIEHFPLKIKITVSRDSITANAFLKPNYVNGNLFIMYMIDNTDNVFLWACT